ncbi:PREDICTED: zinc finger BED domain-containing protein 4-like [Diuraphis noxia]|uniref:zinc finger BED domain-containing protein 4-like n=1 Tax=Diuraphis noxia TaxID=143948 RepID=UPI00076368D4|nr:PREDICTED: zinc finger BED domain-containing protein 4-like [Diuraphis noxia]
MAKEYQPFSLVKNKEFKIFVSLLNPSYSLPSRKTITYNILPQLLENTREKVKRSLDNASYIAMSTDGWTSVNNETHSINLIAQCGLEEIKEIHKKVKKIVEHFKRSSQAAAKLKNTQIQMNYPVLKLKQDVITRWNSTYDMFNRCLETKDPLVSTLAMIGKTEMLTASDFNLMDYYCKLFKPFKEVTIELSSEKGVSISKVIVLTNALLSHIKTMRTEKNLPLEIYSMILKMGNKAKNRFAGMEDNYTFAEATLIDPRFKKKGFSSETYYIRSYQNVVGKISSIIKRKKQSINQEENIVTDNEQITMSTEKKETFDIWKEFDSQVKEVTTVRTDTSDAIVELDKFLNEPLIPRESDPLVWWKEMKRIYPNIYHLMLQRLGVPSTSVPCERTFSKAGYTQTDRRNRLSIKNMETLMFLNGNL